MAHDATDTSKGESQDMKEESDTSVFKKTISCPNFQSTFFPLPGYLTSFTPPCNLIYPDYAHEQLRQFYLRQGLSYLLTKQK